MTCDAHLTVTETVSTAQIIEALNGCKATSNKNDLQNLWNFQNVDFIPHLDTFEDLSERSENLSQCLEWTPPPGWVPSYDPNWVPMNACCGSKKYNNNDLVQKLQCNIIKIKATDLCFEPF